jgi:hypothetical protein
MGASATNSASTPSGDLRISASRFGATAMKRAIIDMCDPISTRDELNCAGLKVYGSRLGWTHFASKSNCCILAAAVEGHLKCV